MKKILFLVIFLLVTGVCSFGQNIIIDSLKTELKALPQKDTIYLTALNNLASELVITNSEEAANYVNYALLLSDSLNYTKGKIRALTHKGNAFWVNSLYDQALTYYLRALELESTNSDIEGRQILYNNIAEVFKKKNRYDSALLYFDKAMSFKRQHGGVIYPLFYSNIAETFFFINAYDSARFYYNRALEEASIKNDSRTTAYALAGLGELAYINDSLSTAIKYYGEALSKSSSVSDKRNTTQILIRMGEMLFENDDLTASSDQFAEAERLAKEIKAFDLLSEIYLSKAEIYESSGNYEMSVRNLKSYNSLKDSLDKISFASRINQIKTALNAEIQIAENKVLTAKQENNKAYINMLLILSAVIFIILIVALFLLRKYVRNLRYSKTVSSRLNELYEEISLKNKEINRINSELDQQLRTTSKILSESERLAKLGGWQYDLTTGEMFWTEEVYRQLGLESQKVEPSIDTLKNALDKEQFWQIENGIIEVIRSQSTQNTTITLLKDQKASYFNLALIPEWENGKITKIYGSNHDITDLVIEEQKEKTIINSLLEHSKKTHLKTSDFSSFIENLLIDASKTIDVDRTSFWIYNQEQHQLNCFSLYDGRKDEFLKAETLSQNNYPKYFEAISSQRTVIYSNRKNVIENDEFAEYFALYNIKTMMDSQVVLKGKMLGIICFEKTAEDYTWSYSDQRYSATLADIISNAYSTHQNRELEDEKANLIKKLLKKNQSLREFAYVISHNLRDPVSQILGFSDLYQKPDSNDIKNDLISWIQKSARNLDTIIKDLTFVLRQNEAEHKEKQSAYLLESIQSVKMTLTKELSEIQPKINLDFKEDYELPLPPTYLYNIIYNLLSNSLKYRNPDRQLVIDIKMQNNQSEFLLTYADNGIGLDVDRYRDKLFKMYQRFHLEKEGRGLGLYLVKSQLDGIGGSIEVESEIGNGTRFFITIPAKNNEFAPAV